MRILNVAGARPNFMKIAPIMRAFDEAPGFSASIVHTGQHYDDQMSKVFFDDLEIPTPSVNLEVGSGERLAQIERIAERFDPVVRRERPDAVLVVGDVNSTVACATVARSHGVAVIHVEAGLRSFDMDMPEEVNRIETDRLSDLLFVTEPSGMTNLAAEKVPGKAFLVGNVMIDTLVRHLDKARARRVHERLDLEARGFIVGTFHRPSNVDAKLRLENVVSIVEHAARQRPVVLPLHPRTRASLTNHGLEARLTGNPDIRVVDPLGYLDFVSLIDQACAVVTDSGGIQEETTFLRVPCVTMRDNTERPITVEVGSNVLAGTEPKEVTAAIDDALAGVGKGEVPDLWDGRAAGRIIEVLMQECGPMAL
ncbi:MAG: UDP-N-acetylglucosamine 2-epimerase (non-hydrolyzing) [Roseibium album]|uniref:non-hydrolyzing UDP-N-acetylglucosamine 2-epimerase n=1 Tax=Roseibium album TaxID=311410 RepID=UPI0032EC70EC